MGRVYLYILLLSVWGCGDSNSTGEAGESEGGGSALSGSVWRDAAKAILDAEGVARHAAACDLLTSRGVVAGLYSVPADLVTYRPMTITSIPHAYCGASWAKANKVELKEAFKKSMSEYSQRKVKAMLARKPFDEPMPTPVPADVSISITIGSPMFDSSEQAIEALKSQRSTLAKGVDVEVMGETRTVKMDDIDEWIDDIGDGGAWSPNGNGLSVVSDGVILTVTTKGFGEEDRARAEELANYIISGT